MRLHGPQTRFVLELVGRPDNESWLRVQVTVDDPHESWTGSSRCLLSSEVERLADWLERVSIGEHETTKFETCDGLLDFEVLGTEPRRLRIYMESPFRPARTQGEEFGEFFRDFPVTDESLERSARVLRDMLQQTTRGSER